MYNACMYVMYDKRIYMRIHIHYVWSMYMHVLQKYPSPTRSRSPSPSLYVGMYIPTYDIWYDIHMEWIQYVKARVPRHTQTERERERERQTDTERTPNKLTQTTNDIWYDIHIEWIQYVRARVQRNTHRERERERETDRHWTHNANAPNKLTQTKFTNKNRQLPTQ